MSRKAIIIGAGPAGLTAAYELLTRTDIIPIILEKSGEIGGISRTTNYKGNRMDMGPHRFFSKSDRVMDWWLKMMPLEESTSARETTISYQNKSRNVGTRAGNGDPEKSQEKLMLVIKRLTRIYFLRKFFAYPIQLSIDTLRTLGLIRTIKILLSFFWIRLFPHLPEKNLEDFIINKFGRQLYLLFFKDYTEKVWGIAPAGIPAEWGAQRIKGISLGKAIASALKDLRRKKPANDIHQKGVETSLIEQFLYPKYGPGSMWEEAARKIAAMGGKLYLHQDVQHIYTEDGRIQSVVTVNSETGQTGAWEADFFFSTMPVQELIAGIGDAVPAKVQEIAAGLQYRDFINVGVLLKNLSDRCGNRLDLKDNWIYIQERDVKVGRLMIYNNWGGGMVRDPKTTWIGMEYFCDKTDDFWAQPDEVIQRCAIAELQKMDLARPEDVLDSTVRRMEKTYPAYFGTYSEFDQIRAFTDGFKNLFLVGRNGMHKYNNADHSMLTAMVAVDNIVAGIASKANIWSINTEQEYHEEKVAATVAPEKSASGNPAKYPFLVDYLWNNRSNRTWWLVGIAAIVLQFILFKFRYPFANYMPDSYSYLNAAATNVDVNMWPVAYSKFLRLVSVFTHSDKAVVGLQYLFLQTSTLLFVFTLFFFLSPGKPVRRLLMLFVLLNPVPLYVANYISADGIFIGLSLSWLTTLVWIIYRPRPWMVPFHAFILLTCFTVRYNAIYYPVISLFAFAISRQAWRYKLTGVALSLGMVMASILYTARQMQSVTGKRQFSAFAGWQLANNALYMYEHVPAGERGNVPARFSKLERMVRTHMDTLSRVKLSKEDSVTNYFYLWSGKGPLIQYMIREWGKDSTTPYFTKWAAEGPLYEDYAFFLIRKFPIRFVENFMLPNALKFAVPPTEFLGTYNMGQDSVGKLAKDWFNYKTRMVIQHNKKQFPIGATEWYPIFSALVNVLLIISMVGLLVFNGFKQKNSPLLRLFILVIGLWILNFWFSIFASPVVLRYQVFSVLITFCMAVMAIESIYTLALREELARKSIAI